MEILHTGVVEPGLRFAMWRDVVRSICGQLNVVSHRNGVFSGHVHKRKLGRIQTSVITADPHTVVRPHRAVGGVDGEAIYLCGVSAGELTVSQDGREATARAGELICFDNTRIHTLTMPERFSMVSLVFPHRLVGLAPAGTTGLTAATWAAGEGVAGLLSQFLSGLSRHMSELDDQTAQQLDTVTASLIATLFGERLRRQIADPEATRHALLLRIQAFAREYLGDRRLDPTMLARRHNISLRYLQKLFQEQGLSPASWIRDERLARCRSELQDPRLAHLTVATIGERSGLAGASHFSRLFREQYGMTPQEFRRLRGVVNLPVRSRPSMAGPPEERRQATAALTVSSPVRLARRASEQVATC